jgi:CheY-like chemotaxis protein
MNLVLTSMQEHGYIKISLNCEDMSTKEPDTSMAMVELTVEDSGKGISQAYMDTKMFTSFAQEDPMAPSTGLGLSLVRSLVQMMDGEIEVHSEVNHGTKVKVRIAMRRAGPRDLRDGFHRPNEDDIQALRTILPRPQIVNFQQDILPEDTPQKQEGYQMQKHALAACINGWYKVEALHHWDIDTDIKPDIILVDDVHLLAITKHLNRLKEIDAVVVILCSDRSRTTAISKNVDYPKLHIMPKPFGPFKLAKALKHALDKRGPIRGTPSGPTIAEEIGPIPELKQLSPTLRRVPSNSGNLSKLTKKPSFNGSFPFPSMTVTPASTSPAPRIPVTTPQLEVSGTHHRRLKILDVPSSKQKPLEEHNKFIRSHSEGGQTENSQYKAAKPKVLLVDDNEVNLKLLQTFFVRRGFTDMRLARDGSEAVKVYEDALHEHDPFHLVFMDISMPVRFGKSICLTLLDSNPEIRSWMVSKLRISSGKRRFQQHIPTNHTTA